MTELYRALQRAFLQCLENQGKLTPEEAESAAGHLLNQALPGLGVTPGTTYCKEMGQEIDTGLVNDNAAECCYQK